MQGSIAKPDSFGEYAQQVLVDDLRRQVTQQHPSPRQHFLLRLQAVGRCCGRAVLDVFQLVISLIRLLDRAVVGACVGIGGLLRLSRRSKRRTLGRSDVCLRVVRSFCKINRAVTESMPKLVSTKAPLFDIVHRRIERPHLTNRMSRRMFSSKRWAVALSIVAAILLLLGVILIDTRVF